MLVEKLKLSSVDLVKIDVEGAACEVVAGGMKTIKKYRPTILLEVHNRTEEEAV